MLIRLRSRDGLERLEVGEYATVGDLKQAICAKMGVPYYDITLSQNKALLTDVDPSKYTDLAQDRKRLRAAGLEHGSLVQLLYPFKRRVEATVKPSVFGTHGFGAKFTVQDMIAAQTRIERQETSHCTSVSFDKHAANAFQSYVMQMHAFSIKRGGILYGTVAEDGGVKVHAIYEPPQRGTKDSLTLERHTDEEERADFIARVLGLQKVGWIFTQSDHERDTILNAEEVQHMAQIQVELGEHAATGVVAALHPEDGPVDVQFEAFQVSDQAVRLFKEGWFLPAEDPAAAACTLRDPRDPKKKDPVIVAGKDASEVDNTYFLLPVGILDHEGPLGASFPIENRHLPQGQREFKTHMSRPGPKSFTERLADFHVLLWLSGQASFELRTDIAALAEAVKDNKPVPEGYRLILDSLLQS